MSRLLALSLLALTAPHAAADSRAAVAGQVHPCQADNLFRHHDPI